MADTLDHELHQLAEQYQPETALNAHPPKERTVRLSEQILDFITEQGETPERLSELPIVQPPPVDDSFPLSHYFISSSHNTYLLARQLVGRASAACYTHVLSRNARCVEIDVWPSAKGLIVTHGYTFSKGITFQSVCVAIADMVQPEDWPVFVSLENHVPVERQDEMIKILEGAFGDKLVKGPLELGDGNAVCPRDLKGRVILMVEYYPPTAADGEAESEPESSSDPECDEGEGRPTEKKKDAEHSHISDTLASLGYYARSMKPGKNWLHQDLKHPKNILINVSESTLSSLVHKFTDALADHSLLHMRRVYPRGTRIESSNMDVLKSWRTGSQVTALNWQTYDKSMQINEGMFVDSPGYVLKPAKLLGMGQEMTSKLLLVAEIVGISSLPPPSGSKSFSAIIKAELLHSVQDQQWKSKPVKCVDVSNGGADIMWNERFEWAFDSDDLAFIRLLVKESELLEDEHLAVFCARVSHLQQGWRLVRLLDMKGKSTGATALVRFTITIAE